MVGIVIVSHSAKIAEGIREVSLQMANPEQKIVAAGGTEDGRIGTSAILIKEAIENANQGDGVIIFFDLGSALLSAETAIDMLEDNNIAVRITDAPLVEGAFVAAIQASIGSKLEEVLAVAEASKNMSKL